MRGGEKKKKKKKKKKIWGNILRGQEGLQRDGGKERDFTCSAREAPSFSPQKITAERKQRKRGKPA